LLGSFLTLTCLHHLFLSAISFLTLSTNHETVQTLSSAASPLSLVFRSWQTEKVGQIRKANICSECPRPEVEPEVKPEIKCVSTASAASQTKRRLEFRVVVKATEPSIADLFANNAKQSSFDSSIKMHLSFKLIFMGTLLQRPNLSFFLSTELSCEL
jgi:hypothetical protein